MKVSWIETGYFYFYFIFFLWRCGPTRASDLHLNELSRSHTTPHHTRQGFSGCVIESSQKPSPDNTQHSQQTNIYVPGGIRNPSPSKRTAADPCLIPRGHWDRLFVGCNTLLERLCNQLYNMNGLLIRDGLLSVVIWWKVIKVHFFLYHTLKMCGEVEV
jgi:hypothetical protein